MSIARIKSLMNTTEPLSTLTKSGFFSRIILRNFLAHLPHLLGQSFLGIQNRLNVFSHNASSFMSITKKRVVSSVGKTLLSTPSPYTHTGERSSERIGIRLRCPRRNLLFVPPFAQRAFPPCGAQGANNLLLFFASGKVYRIFYHSQLFFLRCYIHVSVNL